MALKVVIIGGVAGGATAAARLRRLDEEAQIIMFEKGEHISFANCGLPYYIGGVIKDKSQLLVQTPERMKKRFNIDVRINNEVVRINRDSKTVEAVDKSSGKIYTESYDKLVLSPGAEPVVPGLPGVKSERIFTLRNIPDTYKIKDYIDKYNPRRAVVVGAGFIGLEMAENLHLNGIKVTVVELADHVIGPLDFDMAALVHQHMKQKNVEFYLKDAVQEFIPSQNYISVRLSSNRVLKADMVIMAIGVRPETKLAAEAGLELGATRGILVNSRMQTTDPDIYAVGDAVEVKDYISNVPVLIPLAGPANRQGRIAANNICGIDEEYTGTQGTSIVRVFDITVAITGNNEKSLIKNNIEYEKSFTHSPSHAGYYPGAVPMSIKLLFGKDDGRVLGAQIIGYEGADKRIDVVATAIRAGMSVHELEKLELAYAPPYSSAKDPVNIAGYVAANILKRHSQVFHWHEVSGINERNGFLIDVRTPSEYALGTIEGAVNIPVDDLRENLDRIPKDKDIYVFCQVGLRGHAATRLLMQRGFRNVRNLSGGYKTWQLAISKQANEDIYEYDSISRDDDLKSTDVPHDSHSANIEIRELDVCGLQCPEPIMKVYSTINSLNPGDTLKVKSGDLSFAEDLKAWCSRTGNNFVSLSHEGKTFTAIIRKASSCAAAHRMSGALNDISHSMSADTNGISYDGKTMIVFSSDLDKAIASFIIANGAAAMGRKVTMFFTFWGLNILRRPGHVHVRKDLISRMFGFMMPKGSKKLSLSKMNMLGIGPLMIRYLMKKKGVNSLEALIRRAIENGVSLVACSMSMDIMGIKQEELIDGVQTGGVASFLGAAEEADTNLFI